MTERTSYLTADEVQAVSHLHRVAPYALCNVSHGFFSIARHYGGLTYQGCHYTCALALTSACPIGPKA